MDGPAFEIIAGFHGGATRRLDKLDYRIGSSPGADIVLLDPGVEPEHALLRIERSGARVEAVGGDLHVGAERLAQGHGCRVRYPFELSLGQARVRLTSDHVEPSLMTTAGKYVVRRPLATGGAILAALLLLALIAGRPSGDAGLTPRSGYVPAAAAAPDSKDAARQLSERLENAGIRGLNITTVDGRVAVSGVIPSASAASWNSIQQWFDQTYKGRLLLTPAVAIGEGKNLTSKIRLQAVWFGERPYVISGDGVRRYEGGALEDGWVIKEIRDSQIKLAKDGQTMTLKYR